MSNSAINTQVAQLKIGNVQNQADNSAVYSAGVWSFKNSTALTSVTITDAGNVGIGTASPGARLDIQSANQALNPVQIRFNTSNEVLGFGIANSNGFPYIGYNTKSAVGTDIPTYERSNFATQLRMDNGEFKFSTAASGTAGNAITFTERMRIDASGRLLVGATVAIASSGAVIQGSNTSAPALALNRSNDGGIVYFYRGGAGPVGEIAVTASNTAYNTSGSDYRLKEQIQNLSGGLDKIKALRPVSFMWKQSQKQDIGFIAHEVQSVIPECITGQKDAVDDEGNPVYQSIFPAPAQMIANLVAAIQEQQAQIEALKAEVAALKAP